MKWKKGLCFVWIIILIMQLAPLSIYADNDFYIEYDGQVQRYAHKIVKIEIDGDEIQTGDMPAIIISENGADRTLVPAREVFESDNINATVEWNNDKQEVYISFEDTFIKLKINSQIAYINNVETQLDVPAKLIKDASKEYAKTMIPLRFVAEAMKYEVEWNQEEYKAILSSTSKQIEAPIEEEETEEEETDDPTEEISEDEKLDDFDGTSSSKSLPTPLADAPVKWMADGEILADLIKIGIEDPIEAEEHPLVNIEDITYNINGQTTEFVIEADGKISDVEQTIWEDKLILDIENAVWDLSSSEKTYDDPSVKSIRSSQFSEDPMVTRIVIDSRYAGVQYNVKLSEDRENILVTVVNNVFYKVEIGQDKTSDYIELTGLEAPEVSVFRLSNPTRLVIDLPHTISALNYQTVEVEGQYLQEVRTAQFNETTSRVVLVTDGHADYNITKENGTTTIQVLEPGFKNISYENYDVPTLEFKVPSQVELEDLTFQDLYLDKEFIIEMPGNQMDLYGTGIIEVHDSNIESAVFSLNNEGNTELKIKANKIYAYDIEEVSDQFVVKLYPPEAFYSKIIVVDAGHGGKDPGASSNGLTEKELNLDIVLYLKEWLDQEEDIKVYYTRLDDTYPTLQERALLANEVEADFFLSVHNNAYFSEFNGTETLYLPGGNTSGLDASELAEIFQDALISQLNLNNRGLKQRKDLYVLNNTDMPAVLVEIGFLTSPIDSVQLKTESFKRRAAQALFQAIIKTFKDYPTGR